MIKSCDHGDAIVVYEQTGCVTVDCPMCKAEEEIGDLQNQITELKNARGY